LNVAYGDAHKADASFSSLTYGTDRSRRTRMNGLTGAASILLGLIGVAALALTLIGGCSSGPNPAERATNAASQADAAASRAESALNITQQAAVSAQVTASKVEQAADDAKAAADRAEAIAAKTETGATYHHHYHRHVHHRAPAGGAAPNVAATGEEEEVEGGLPIPFPTPTPSRLPAELPPLYWNAWEEASEPLEFHPLPAVQPGTDFILTLDLSSIAYENPETSGSASKRLANDIVVWLNRWVRSASADVTLDVLLIPDRYFIDSPPLEATMPINLARLRKALMGMSASTDGMQQDNGFARLMAGDDSFQFGRLMVPLSSRPRRTGLASVSLSLWDPTEHPVGELEILICIANDPKDCPRGPLKAGIYEGETLKSSLDATTSPDAAIQLMQRRSHNDVIGIFRTRNMPLEKSLTWNLNSSADMLATSLKNLMPDFFNANDEADLQVAGERLYNLLLPESANGGAKARAAFQNFFSKHLAQAGTSGTPVPSIFARLIQDSTDPPLLLPLALMAVPVGASGIPEFVGRHFRVETPLELQSYTPQTKCISRWMFMIPSDKNNIAGPLEDAYNKLSAGPPSFGQILNWRNNQRPQINGPDDLRNLLKGTLAPNIDTPVSLVIVSHQLDNKLYFHEGELGVTASDISRYLPEQSVAIIAGCNTQGPAALDLVRELNLHGVLALIGTASNIGGDIAGDFVDCFGQAVNAAQSGSGMSVSDAYWKALICVEERSPAPGLAPYGAKGLVFSLSGNGSIPICAPAK
jgi:hypothetical protein